MFYRVGDWDDLLIELLVSLHVRFQIQFAGIVPVFLEFNVLLETFRSTFFFRRQTANRRMRFAVYGANKREF